MKILTFSPTALDNCIQSGMDYSKYRSDFERAALAVKEGQQVDILHPEVLPLNWQRSTRVEKTFRLNDRLRDKLESLDSKRSWLVITEPWCGDSAQTLGAIAQIADASHGMITLRIVLRDQQLELIDAFLTDGKRGIPKLIQLDPSGAVTGTWGPRPKQAQELIDRLKQDPDYAEIYKEELHKWYAHDHGASLQVELLALLDNV